MNSVNSYSTSNNRSDKDNNDRCHSNQDNNKRFDEHRGNDICGENDNKNDKNIDFLCSEASNNQKHQGSEVFTGLNDIKQKDYKIRNNKWKCDVCNIFCNSESQYEVHMLSQKHKTCQLRQKQQHIQQQEQQITINSVESIGSNTEFSKAVVDESIQNEVNEKSSENLDELKHNHLAAECNIDVKKYLIPEDKRVGKYQKFGFYCMCCDAYMTGQIQLIMHVKGAKHQYFFPNEVPGYTARKAFFKRKSKKRDASKNQLNSYMKNDAPPKNYQEFSQNQKIYKNESMMNNGNSGQNQNNYNSNVHRQNLYSNTDYCQQPFFNVTSIGATQSKQGAIYQQRYAYATSNNNASNSSRSYTMKLSPTNAQSYQTDSNHHPLNSIAVNSGNQSTNIEPSHVYYSIPSNSFYYSNNTDPNTGIASINPQYASVFSHHPHGHHHLSSSYNNLQQDGYSRYPNLNGTPVTTIHYNAANNQKLLTATTAKTANYLKQFNNQTPSSAKQSQQILIQPQQKYLNERKNSVLVSSSSSSKVQSQSSSQIQETRDIPPTYYFNLSANQNKSNLWTTTDATFSTHAVCNTSGVYT